MLSSINITSSTNNWAALMLGVALMLVAVLILIAVLILLAVLSNKSSINSETLKQTG
jgi:hypothetical protein